MTRPANRSDRPPADVKAGILEYALELGFDTAGVSRTDDVEVAGERFRNFLALGRHGDMAWLAEKSDRRARPKNLWPDVKSVVVVGMNYGPEGDPLEVLAKPQLGALSVYARGRDYHDVIKKRLKRLARWMVQTYGGDVKVFVDTAPVLEKPLAASAGLGWQGKHTSLVSRSFGSWLFLGSVFTTIDLAPDAAEGDHCGDCRACLDVCPTDAFPAPYQLDARRCISYLTIEHKGHIPPDLRVAIGNRIFGCDDCLAVCPWNKFARQAHEAAFHPRSELTALKLGQLSDLDDGGFRALFSSSNIKRTGRDRFIRNVLIAIGNSGDVTLIPNAERRLADPSPLVRAMAVWALRRLLDDGGFGALKLKCFDREDDRQVQREWKSDTSDE